MKTVQQHLRELDRARLIDEYHYRIRDRIVEAYLNVDDSEIADLTLEEIYRRNEENIGAYIDRLREMETAPLQDGSTGLLYLYDRITDALNYANEPCCRFAHLEDVIERGDAAENYSYKLCSQAELMGVLVSDDRFTQTYIYDLAIAVMYDASEIEHDDVDARDDVELEYQEILRRANEAVERYNRQSAQNQLMLIQCRNRRDGVRAGADGLKTVQQYLRELDRERLIENYLRYTRTDILDYYRDDDEDERKQTIRQIREHDEKFIGEYLDRLRNLEEEDDRRGLLYAFKFISDLSECKPEPCCAFVLLEDVLELGGDATRYAYDFYAQSEIMGVLVSDDEYTQQNIYAVMTDVMFEASWFGYADEGKEEFVDALAEHLATVEAGTIETVPKYKDEAPIDAEAACAEALTLVNAYNAQSNKKKKRLIQRRLLDGF